MKPMLAERHRASPAGGVTPAELREAERGFKLMLARKFSAAWIAENAGDLLAQANIEYAEWLEVNPPANKPVGWLLTCAYRRALNLLDSQTRKPRSTPLEAVFHLADESTPTPEQQALDSDRQKRLREALSYLPAKERRLLALVYFEDYSIRGAGRKLGWQKSAADRHHNEAMKKMLALVGDRSLLSPSILGPVAWAVVRGEGRWPLPAPLQAMASLAREGMAVGAEALTVAAHRLSDVWRRLVPFSESANAAATGGAGRAAGYCAATAGAVVCGLIATGVVGPGLGAVDAEQAKPPKPQGAKPSKHVSAPAAVAVPKPDVVPSSNGPANRADPPTEQSASKPRESDPRPHFPPQATTHETVHEFGVDHGSGESSESVTPPDSSGGESSPSAPAPQPSPAPKSPDSAASAEFGM